MPSTPGRSRSPDPTVTPARPPLPWPSIGLGFAAMFMVAGLRTAFAVLYPTIVADLGWSVGEVTGAFSAGLLVYAPTALAIGVLVDRVGCRVTMLGGCACLLLGMGIVASATELWQLYVGFVLATGLGSSGIGFITVVKLISLRAPGRFAGAFGMAYLGSGVGTLLLSPLVQTIIDLSDWRAAALAVAGLVLVGLVPPVALLAPGPGGVEPRAGPSLGQQQRALSWPFAVLFSSNLMLGYLLLVPTHQVAHSLEVGFSPLASAGAGGLWGALTAVGALLGGWAVERWGGGVLSATAAGLFGVGTAALILGNPESAWLVAVFVLASGLGRGFLGLPLVAAQTRAFAGPRLGRFTGVLDLGFGIGAFLGPWLTAVVHDLGGSFAPGLVSAILSAAGVAATTTLGARLAAAPDRTRESPGRRDPTGSVRWPRPPHPGVRAGTLGGGVGNRQCAASSAQEAARGPRRLWPLPTAPLPTAEGETWLL